MSAHVHRILLVEDDRFLRKAATVMLRKLGHTVITAEDGEEALRLARAELPELILLDLIMPKIQGFEVLRTLKADPSTSGIPVIVMSNLSQDTDKQSTLNAGAIAYLVKANLSLTELAAAVDRAMTE
jgi:twitching motility two-component system response regulator PilH